MAQSTAQTRTLVRAAELVGGAERLAERLRVPLDRLRRWMNGDAAVPADVFLRALDIVAGRSS